MDMQEISLQLQAGKAKIVKNLVQEALDQGISAKTILEEGLLAGMSVVGGPGGCPCHEHGYSAFEG